MIIAFCFIGILPDYIKETIHQVRLFFDGDVYLITNQLGSQYINDITSYNVNIINYDDVKSDVFYDVATKNRHKFHYMSDLIGRENLFMTAFERFFVLQNLLKKNNIEDCLFLELDNLIYDDPSKWLSQFSKNELCYMFDNYNRYSSGLMYVKNYNSLSGFLEEALEFIKNSSEFLNEMTVLYNYYIKNKENVQILPTYWQIENAPEELYINYLNYNNTIFDSAPMGCYLLGLHPYHTNGILIKNQKSPFTYLDCTKNKFTWLNDDKGRRRPFIWNGENWILINNLHVHAKNLNEGLSLPL
uniref:Nucleotide-diphospho-sugar transferase domain-containing protein n=1 Tax=viral metagenome TaxID=1070528 RepID=A0A6C0JL19_9ZZZZ